MQFIWELSVHLDTLSHFSLATKKSRTTNHEPLFADSACFSLVCCGRWVVIFSWIFSCVTSPTDNILAVGRRVQTRQIWTFLKTLAISVAARPFDWWFKVITMIQNSNCQRFGERKIIISWFVCHRRFMWWTLKACFNCSGVRQEKNNVRILYGP